MDLHEIRTQFYTIEDIYAMGLPIKLNSLQTAIRRAVKKAEEEGRAAPAIKLNPKDPRSVWLLDREFGQSLLDLYV